MPRLTELSRSVEGKVVLVTGAASGMGRATAHLFADEGAHVAVTDLGQDRVDAVVAEIDGAGASGAGWVMDVADTGRIQVVVDEIVERFGGLDIVINNAGISPKAPDGGRLGATQTTVDVMRTVQMVNVTAPLMLCNELLEPLKAAQGAVVNVTSIAGTKIHPFAGAAYAMSKAALSAMTRELASEFGTTGVRVNAVAPGEIDTSILSPGTEDLVHREVPMDRLGSPEEVAEVVHFLCGSKASYVNGTEIHINGGQHV